jgi:hypothetical protein
MRGIVITAISLLCLAAAPVTVGTVGAVGAVGTVGTTLGIESPPEVAAETPELLHGQWPAGPQSAVLSAWKWLPEWPVGHEPARISEAGVAGSAPPASDVIVLIVLGAIAWSLRLL